MRFRFAFGMLGTLAALVVPRPLTMPKSVLSSADDIEGRRLHHASARGGGCKANIFIFARGTGEFGDMVSPYEPPNLDRGGGSFPTPAHSLAFSQSCL